MQTTKSTAYVWLWISGLVILLDQITKFFAAKYLPFEQPVAIFPFFNLTLLHNQGSAFGFLGKAGTWTSWFLGSIAVVISLFILFWLRKIPRSHVWSAIALTLILGGALGNLMDRIIHGYVIDFIQVYYHQWYWPAFNMADSAICVGGTMLVIEALFFRTNK